MRARTALAVMVVLAVAAAYLVSRDSNDGEWAEQPGEVVLASTLVAFDACDELLAYTTEHALSMVGPWGLGGDFQIMVDEPMELEMDDADAPADDASARTAAGPVEGVDFSGTNVQETSVDEPDDVKTDGQRIFTVRDDRLRIIDVTGASPQALATVRLDGWGNQLLLDGDRLLVIGSTEAGMRPTPEPAGRIVVPWTSSARLSLYDVGDPSAPTEVAVLDLDGRVVSARLVDGVARVVLRAEPVGLNFSYPEGQGLRAEQEATERNREVIRASTVENWVPYYLHDAGGRRSEGTLLDCARVQHPTEFAGLGTTSVLSVDLSGDLRPAQATAVLAGGETVYASTERLYTATNRWIDWEALSEPARRDASEQFTTDLHAFDITDSTGARYLGSGNVRGHVLNQWSMSAHDGVLRVATTEGPSWGWGWRDESEEPGMPALSESFVTTFTEADDSLVELGQVGGLGLDERIYAVRFMGDVGYVVTFRETDPLYTLDLSDPTAPAVLGELKIMGYSAYLHPVGDGLLLGVGQDADERGMTTGLQLSLFDVSDLADPQRIHQVTVPDAHSAAEWDHHAFLHWPATGLTVIPYETWRWDEDDGTEEASNGALAYTLDRAAGFAELGRVTHLPADLVDSTQPRFHDLVWRTPVRRSMVIGERLYTLSDLGLKGNDLSTLTDLAWLAFD